jgi:hypothetical protein
LDDKSDLKGKLIDIIVELRNLSKRFKFLRLDDVGNNFALGEA